MAGVTFPKILLSVAAVFVLAVAARASEVFATLADGQRIQGSVPPGEDIRLRFPLTAGAEPRITLTLLGSRKFIPISFTSAKVIGPDGNEIAVPPADYLDLHSTGRDTLRLRGWHA